MFSDAQQLGFRECPARRALLELIKRDIKPRDIMTRAAFENAMVQLSSAHSLPLCAQRWVLWQFPPVRYEHTRACPCQRTCRSRRSYCRTHHNGTFV